MAGIKELTLYCYFQSSAAWRVRAVMTLKKIPFKYEPVNLLDGKQHSAEYLKLNPMHQVPALKVEKDNGEVHLITQSLTIIEFLEENYPDIPIHPKDLILRAKARAIADTVSAGIQPLQNLETLLTYHEPFGLEPLKPEQRAELARFWIDRKLENLEKLIKQTAGKYCVGDQVTVADCALVPQMFNARKFDVDTSRFPTLKEVDERLQGLDMFKSTHPFKCPDAPKK